MNSFGEPNTREVRRSSKQSTGRRLKSSSAVSHISKQTNQTRTAR